ncbi:MAG: N-acetyl-gamma-glutamyl-phosphate reductase, partial [Deltaproteobacteria bacterium]
INLTSVIADSKSGVSGAGRGAKVDSLFCEVHNGFKAYGVATHRHTPEIEQELSLLAGKKMTISFTPHLIPIDRGILSTIYAQLTGAFTTAEILKVYNDFYQGESFVRILPEGDFPSTRHVQGSNFCDIGLVSDQRTGRVVVVSAIDNLVKGASGQAVQNMNIMNGFPENTGLETLPFFP